MFGRSNGFYGQLWGSELVDLHELPPGSDPTVLAMDPWKKNKWKTTWYRFVWFASANRIIDEVLNDAYRCL